MLHHQLHIALRHLRTQRTYTLLNTVGLGVALAGGLLIFLFIRHHLNTDRHHANFARTFRITTDLHLDDGSVELYPEAPLPMAEVLRTDYPQVEQAAFLRINRSLSVTVNQPGKAAPTPFLEQESTALVEPQFFRIFDYQWLGGDPKTALNVPGSVVLTQSTANRYFGNVPAIGQTIKLDHTINATVTGIVADPVNPTDTHVGLFISIATLRQFNPAYTEKDEWWNLSSTDRLYVTLKDPAQASQLEVMFPALAKKQFGDMAKAYQFHTQPLADVHFDVARVGGVIRRSLLWSVGIIGALLVGAACINFVNLATAQALRRSREVGVRKTLGSSRGQLVGQFLLETSLIVVGAMVLAGVLTVVSLPLFNNWLQVHLAPRFDWATLVFLALLPVVVVVLAGTYPAAVLSGFNPQAALTGKLSGTLSGEASRGGFAVRRVLVVAQFVVCQALLVGSVIVWQQVRFVQQTDLGFQPDNVLTVNLPMNGKQSWQTFKDELSGYANIKSVTLQYRPPTAREMNGGPFKFGAMTDWSTFPVRERLADADYLKTYDLQLLAGQTLPVSDSIRGYVINETFLHKLGFQRPQDVLGKPLQYHLAGTKMPIVGVVKDFHLKSLHEPIAPCLIATYPAMYRQAGIRVAGQSSTQTLAHIRAVWQRLYPSDVFEYELLTDNLTRFYETETTLSKLVNVFAGLVVLICCLGLYGLVAQSVVQRTKEIGIRKVLGASVASIVALLSSDFLRLVLIALLIASPLAWWAMNEWLGTFAYKITIDWWVFALAGTLAVAIALLTISFQSMKAALANPVKALRSE